MSSMHTHGTVNTCVKKVKGATHKNDDVGDARKRALSKWLKDKSAIGMAFLRVHAEREIVSNDQRIKGMAHVWNSLLFFF